MFLAEYALKFNFKQRRGQSVMEMEIEIEIQTYTRLAVNQYWIAASG